MVCHGDRGQGFTDEWRGALDPADQNCWQSKCHAANHPPEGFELPRYAPPVIGPGRLAHHQTAAGLYQFLRTRMPWQAPGILSDEEYWGLTAFLAQANGISWGEGMLGPTNAANVALDAQASSSKEAALSARILGIGMFLLAGGILLLLSGIAVRMHRSQGPSRPSVPRRVLQSQIDDSEGS
jgi:cytochrome c